MSVPLKPAISQRKAAGWLSGLLHSGRGGGGTPHVAVRSAGGSGVGVLGVQGPSVSVGPVRVAAYKVVIADGRLASVVLRGLRGRETD